MAVETHAALHPVDPGEESLLILQSLLCLMREKNLLNRSDIEELCAKVERRAAGIVEGPLPCCTETANAAMADMQQMSRYIGQRYGGKHARTRAR